MNTLLTTASLASITVLGPCVMQVAAQDADTSQRAHDHALRSRIVTQSGQGDERIIEVSLRDGEATVTVNGEVLPADRIRNEAGQIVILDADGKPMDHIPITVGDGSGNMNMFFVSPNGAPAWRDAMFNALAPKFEPPAVMMGVNMTSPDAALETHLRLEPGTTTLLSEVYDDLAASSAGLERFDIIVAVDGKSPAGPDVMRELLKSKKAGDTLALTVIHKGDRRDVSLELQAWDGEIMARFQPLRVEMDLIPNVNWFGQDQAPTRLFVDPNSNEFFHDLRTKQGDVRFGVPKDLKITGEDPNDRVRRLEAQLDQLMERLNKLLDERER